MASAWGSSWGSSWASHWGLISPAPDEIVRTLSVRGAMPPSEFGTVLPTPTPQAFIEGVEDIDVVNPTYRELTSKGSLVN